MKKIFDWLREQMERSVIPSHYYIDKNVVLKNINEAEAKWEKDCCEWKETGFSEPTRYFEAHDLMAYELDMCLWNYCPICGKSIKILEVEP